MGWLTAAARQPFCSRQTTSPLPPQTNPGPKNSIPSHTTHTRHQVAAKCLDSYGEWNFWRFDLTLPVSESEARVDYEVSGLPATRSSFFIAGRDQPAHWGYYSCNGFTPDCPAAEVANKWRGITPLWRDVLARHAVAPLHVMVSGRGEVWRWAAAWVGRFGVGGKAARVQETKKARTTHTQQRTHHHHHLPTVPTSNHDSKLQSQTQNSNHKKSNHNLNSNSNLTGRRRRPALQRRRHALPRAAAVFGGGRRRAPGVGVRRRHAGGRERLCYWIQICRLD